MADIEVINQCLGRRIDNIEEVKGEAAAWRKHRNNKESKVNWQLTAENAQTKISRLYLTIDS